MWTRDKINVEIGLCIVLFILIMAARRKVSIKLWLFVKRFFFAWIFNVDNKTDIGIKYSTYLLALLRKTYNNISNNVLKLWSVNGVHI